VKISGNLAIFYLDYPILSNFTFCKGEKRRPKTVTWGWRWEKREGTLWGIALFSQPTGPPMIFLGVFFIVNFVKVKLRGGLSRLLPICYISIKIVYGLSQFPNPDKF
jgi:hypothetical protein